MFHFCHFLNLYHGNLTGLTDMFEFTSFGRLFAPPNADLYIFTKNSDQSTSEMERENVKRPMYLFHHFNRLEAFQLQNFQLRYTLML